MENKIQIEGENSVLKSMKDRETGIQEDAQIAEGIIKSKKLF